MLNRRCSFTRTSPSNCFSANRARLVAAANRRSNARTAPARLTAVSCTGTVAFSSQSCHFSAVWSRRSIRISAASANGWRRARTSATYGKNTGWTGAHGRARCISRRSRQKQSGWLALWARLRSPENGMGSTQEPTRCRRSRARRPQLVRLNRGPQPRMRRCAFKN